MFKPYKTVLHSGREEFIEEKSRFIGCCAPCDTEKCALDFIESIREANPQATHCCYAYYVEENEISKKRYNDDGEPQGTAGLPMLSVIEKEGLKNICVVAVRYFGGVKLGKGGLIRAYTKTSKVGIEAGKIVRMAKYEKLKLTYSYSLSGKLDYFFSETSADIFDKKYETEVSLFYFAEESDLEKKIKQLNDISNAKIKIERLGKTVLPTDDNGNIIKE